MGATPYQNEIEAAESFFRQNPALWSELIRLSQNTRLMIFNTAANYARQVNVAAIAPGIENRVAEIVAAHLQKNSDPLANFPETAKKSFWAAQLKISVKTLDKRITENRIPSDPNLGRTYFRREDIRPLFA